MRQLEDYPWKYWILIFGLIASFGILFVTIFKLMIIRGSYYQGLARDNKILESVVPAARGEILDRKGRVMAKNLYQYFKMDGDNKIFEPAGDFKGYQFEDKEVVYELKRQYPYGESLGLLTGYIGKISEDDLKSEKCGAKMGADEMIGRGGLESYFNCDLRGEKGRRLIEVDARGKYIRELGRQEPIKGTDITLSIDAFWQDKIYKMLSGRKGSVIMSEPSTGKIIAMVSSSSYDPNNFSFEQNNTAITGYLQDKEGLPMLNRVISARYHPGSVFKPVIATAGLESGVIDKNTEIEDTGLIRVGNYTYKTWSGTSDGMVTIVKALKRSNDIYFYRLGEKLGVDRIKLWANKYGYGSKTGVELVGEVDGIVPDSKWKKEVKGESWFLGNTYHLSIGQGDLSITPIQVNQMTNVIANKGVKCKMSLIKDKKVECENLGIKRETIETIIEGMKEACKPGGTAWPLFNFKTTIACKTGTAEVGDGSNDTHAWLTAFVPADNPQISITVMLERAGEGSDEAAPIVGDILKEWFNESDTLVPRYKKSTDVGKS